MHRSRALIALGVTALGGIATGAGGQAPATTTPATLVGYVSGAGDWIALAAVWSRVRESARTWRTPAATVRPDPLKSQRIYTSLG
jgi:hypothetical protein